MAGFYAGIGSRSTPIDMLKFMTGAAEKLSSLGWTLRSGHAPGADQAFQTGAALRAEVYLPWPGFQEPPPQATLVQERPSQAALALAAEFHPGWSALREPVRLLMARNMHQVLGPDLQSPAAFVLCWTPDGSLDGSSRASGGTGQALRLAVSRGVPVFNLARADHRERVSALLIA